MDRFEQMEVTRKVAGVDDMLAVVRLNLKRGASQVELPMGGGAASACDPLDAKESTFGAVKAAVDVASNRGTYVAVHICTSEGVKKAIKAGAKRIGHGRPIAEDIAEKMADKGIGLDMQPFPAGNPAAKALPPENCEKCSQVADGFRNAMRYARKCGVKRAFGSEPSFAPRLNGTQASGLASLGKWFSNFELMKMITSQNAELVSLGDERHPQKEGPLG